MKQISAPDLAALLAGDQPVDILDVREPWEYQLSRIEPSIHIPMGEIVSRVEEIPRDRQIVCLCHHGVRSMQVGMFLEQQGFKTIHNLQGGIDAWSHQVDANCPTY